MSRPFVPGQNQQPRPFASQRPGISRPPQQQAMLQPFDGQRPRSANQPSGAHVSPMQSFASVAAQPPRERRTSGEGNVYHSPDAHHQHASPQQQEPRARRFSNENAANISPEDRRYVHQQQHQQPQHQQQHQQPQRQPQQHRQIFPAGSAAASQQMEPRPRRTSSEGVHEQRGRGPASARVQQTQPPSDSSPSSGTWL